MLKQELLDKTVILLKEAESFIMPVGWLYHRLKENFEAVEFSEQELIDDLKADGQFKVFDGPELGILSRHKTDIEEINLKNLGIYHGPRVMLKSRVPTKKEIITFLLKKADQTFEALLKAWEIRPKEDQDTEDQLLMALAKAQKLQRELKGILEQEDLGANKHEFTETQE